MQTNSKKWHVVLTSEMVAKGLSGHTLVAFAIIHSYSQNGNGMFTGSAQTLADMVGCSLRTAKDILANLTADGHVTRTEYTDKRNVRRVAYQVVCEVSEASEGQPAEQPKERSRKASGAFVAPTVEEVAAYCKERNNGIDAQYFVDRLTAAGWRLKNGQPVKDWRACIRTWESFRRNNGNNGQNAAPKMRKAMDVYGG